MKLATSRRLVVDRPTAEESERDFILRMFEQMVGRTATAQEVADLEADIVANP